MGNMIDETCGHAPSQAETPSNPHICEACGQASGT